MKELPPPSDVKASDSTAGSAPETAAAADTGSVAPGMAERTGARTSPVSFGAIIIVIVAVLLLGQWWLAQRQLGELREDVARRLRSSETATAEARVMLKSIQEGMQALQAKVNVIESRQSETQSQQVALEQLYQELARTRDDWTLAEIEQVLSTANQQLQLAGNVQGAIIALRSADARLALSDTPQFVRVRRAIAEDLERLKALPSVDLASIALRLDSVIGKVDKLPLLADEKPAAPASVATAESAAAPSAGTAAPGNWLARIESLWLRWKSEVWNDVKQVVQVRKVDAPDALLLSPDQAYYARENLKLRLLNARLALWMRNETAFRNDLALAQDVIAHYFDTHARQTQNVQTLLRQVQQSELAIEMPTLAESLNAVRSFTATQAAPQ